MRFKYGQEGSEKGCMCERHAQAVSGEPSVPT